MLTRLNSLLPHKRAIACQRRNWKSAWCDCNLLSCLFWLFVHCLKRTTNDFDQQTACFFRFSRSDLQSITHYFVNCLVIASSGTLQHTCVRATTHKTELCVRTQYLSESNRHTILILLYTLLTHGVVRGHRSSSLAIERIMPILALLARRPPQM